MLSLNTKGPHLWPLRWLPHGLICSFPQGVAPHIMPMTAACPLHRDCLLLDPQIRPNTWDWLDYSCCILVTHIQPPPAPSGVFLLAPNESSSSYFLMRQFLKHLLIQPPNWSPKDPVNSNDDSFPLITELSARTQGWVTDPPVITWDLHLMSRKNLSQTITMERTINWAQCTLYSLMWNIVLYYSRIPTQAALATPPTPEG